MASSKRYDQLIRVSQMGTRGENDETTRTIEQQRQANEACASARGGRIGHTFQMTDESGGTVLQKIGAEVVERVRRGESAGLIVAYSDRLCRDVEAGAWFLGRMAEVEAELIDATNPGLDYRADAGRMAWLMTMVVNEQPRLVAKRRGKNVRASQMKAGAWPSRVPFGYQRNGQIVEGGAVVKLDDRLDVKGIVPDPATAPIVRRIFQMRDDSMSWTLMADTLNADNVPGPTGGLWTTSGLHMIIRREVYTGTFTNGSERIDDACEAIVSRALWLRVQRGPAMKRTGRLTQGIAGSLLRCAHCGLSMRVYNSGGGRHTYGCKQRSSTVKCAAPVYVSKARIDEYVLALLHDLCEGSEGIDAVAAARDVERARFAVEQATMRRKEFVRKFADTIDEDDFREGYAERKQIEDDAVAHYELTLSRAGDLETLPTSGNAFDDLDDVHKRLIAKQLIESVIVSSATSRHADAPIEDRVEVIIAGGAWKMNRAGWQRAA